MTYIDFFLKALELKDETRTGWDLRNIEHPSREYSQYTKIINLFVKDEHQNQGYGARTIEKVKKIARERGSDHLKVSSEWENKGARKFYKNNGFEEKQVEYVQKLE